MPTTNRSTAGPEILHFLENEIEQIRMFTFDKQDSNPEVLQAFLTAQNVPAPTPLPTSVEGLDSIGCVMLDYQGTKLSVICFKGESVYHVVTADKEGFPMEVSETAQVIQLPNFAFRFWSEGNQVRMIAVQGSEQDLPTLI